METRAPTAVRILIAIGFAISCFALALFLWVAFGGPVPLKSEGYRFNVPFDEATQLAQESDVRISGVSVGKVKRVELSDGGQAVATIELESRFAPVPEDTSATLRQKTLLGETFVELTPGSEEAAPLPEGGTLDSLQVAESVQIDELFRTFDEPTREAFRTWMQTQALALQGRGRDLSTALGSLEPFAQQASTALRVLDSDEEAVTSLIQNGGEVFEALSERRGQLSGLIKASDQVFAATARRNAEIEQIFTIFPTFLRESRATLTRLEEFAVDTDPLITQLRPAARELSPTFADLGALAPDLERFLRGFGDTIDAGRQGLPALQRLIGDDLRPLLARIDPYFAEINSILEVVGLYRSEITAFLGNVAAAANGQLPEGDPPFHHLRTSAVFGPESLAALPERLTTNRSNPYIAPLGYQGIGSGLDSFETRQCTSGARALLDPGDAVAFPGDLFARLQKFAFADQIDSDNLPTPNCTQQPDFNTVGENSEQSQYLKAREQPAP